MIGKYLEKLRNDGALVHCITNYVTVNDCANILLASGASPIMADDKNEVEEIQSICTALDINIGTLNERTIESMFLAGKKANEIKHPVILDPVGVGASSLRTDTAISLIEEIDFSVIRGNISEIKTLAFGQGNTQGVDACDIDVVTEDNIAETIDFLSEYSQRTGAIIVVTGAIDIVTDGNRSFVIRNGVPMMSSITGTGCMLTAMTAAYISANRDDMVMAVAASVCAMGVCGELAYENLNGAGNMTFRNLLIDHISKLDSKTLEKRAVYELR